MDKPDLNPNNVPEQILLEQQRRLRDRSWDYPQPLTKEQVREFFTEINSVLEQLIYAVREHDKDRAKIDQEAKRFRAEADRFRAEADRMIAEANKLRQEAYTIRDQAYREHADLDLTLSAAEHALTEAKKIVGAKQKAESFLHESLNDAVQEAVKKACSQLLVVAGDATNKLLNTKTIVKEELNEMRDFLLNAARAEVQRILKQIEKKRQPLPAPPPPPLAPIETDPNYTKTDPDEIRADSLFWAATELRGIMVPTDTGYTIDCTRASCLPPTQLAGLIAGHYAEFPGKLDSLFRACLKHKANPAKEEPAVSEDVEDTKEPEPEPEKLSEGDAYLKSLGLL